MAVSIPAQSPLPPPTPSEQVRYVKHLYWDMAWYGLLAGSTLAFVTIYITRLGAAPWQLGLINAGPALVGLAFTLPLGRWLHDQPIGPAVFRSAVLNRVFYLPFALLPLLLPPAYQVWSYILLTLLMAVPGTALAVGFNALYAAAVPPEARGQVSGIRNAILAIVYVATSLGCGFLLSRTPLAVGYPIVFALGFVGAAMSTLHVWFLRGLTGREGIDPSTVRAPLGDHAAPGTGRPGAMGLRSSVALRVFVRARAVLRPEILRTPFGGVLGSLFLFHFFQNIPIALFPLMWVNELHFSDQQISVGTAVFHVCVLAGSLRLGWITERRGNLWIMVTGVVGLSLYPLLVAFAHGMPLYLVASAVGGTAWALVGGALANYLLELVPRDDRPAHLAWYNLALNAGVLLGALSGPLLADAVGLRGALVVGFALRLLGGISIWWTGRRAYAPWRVAAPAPLQPLGPE